MKRILIVDDELLILFALKKALHSEKREVKDVATGAEALKEIAEKFYDLCFLDIYLPDMNGLEVMKKIREISPGTRVIIMTASNISDDMGKSIEGGAFHFMTKPFHINEVRAIAKHALNEHEDLPSGFKTYVKSMKNKRQFERTPVGLESTYYIYVDRENSRTKEFANCNIIDVSFSGMGIGTSYPLEPGCKLHFTRGGEKKEGVVRWIKMTDTEHTFRAGIKFQ